MRSLLLLLLLLPRDDAIRLLLVRHGRTFMNEHPSQPGKAAVGFVDPGLWDTRLTPTGEAQARELNAQLRVRQSAGEPGIDLLLASPLRRALATAEIGFDGVACTSQRVEPLAAEQLIPCHRVRGFGNRSMREVAFVRQGRTVRKSAASWADGGKG